MALSLGLEEIPDEQLVPGSVLALLKRILPKYLQDLSKTTATVGWSPHNLLTGRVFDATGNWEKTTQSDRPSQKTRPAASEWLREVPLSWRLAHSFITLVFGNDVQ
jgi:hypothetical protein